MAEIFSDKDIDKNRYDERAKCIAVKKYHEHIKFESKTDLIPAYLRTPYIFYEKLINKQIRSGHIVLELGGGSGEHTLCLLKTGAQVLVNDISESSLKLLLEKGKNYGHNLIPITSDMERLPIKDDSVDFVVCAGSMSYGDPKLVDSEIIRVLRPGGTFIGVDSLNESMIYRFNRWIHYLRGDRTISTLKRMPDINRLESIGMYFEHQETAFFGGISFLMPIISVCTGHDRAKNLSDGYDRWFGVRKSAFKYVVSNLNLKKSASNWER